MDTSTLSGPDELASEAVILTVTVPDTELPSTGLIIVTSGRRLLTSRNTGIADFVFPLALVTRAVS